MGASSLACFSSLFAVFPSHNNAHNKPLPFCSNPSKPLFRLNKIRCGLPESGIRQNPSSSRASSSKNRMEEYNLAMKKMMRNPYEYHHELGMNYTVIADNLIVGSQPQKPEDIDFLKEEEGVAYILNLQQDKDVEYWGIDLQSVIERCKELGIHHMRQPAKDFDPDSLRNGLPKAVSLLEWAISEGKGKAYVHCTAGLGRAPALNTAYEALTSKRPCGPSKKAIRGATYDLSKNDPGKEPFESLPDNAFEDIADWERNLIQDRVRSLRRT
ncbi:Phosphoglucan phosphatase LSF2, chloroplastic [Cucurbita argyrosperma subsp. argyrosperma]|nr:Phosphoglucan phosphatase LSF2, chloroplastic [Cucurbita argyrosperma subsp. argyrosperma]